MNDLEDEDLGLVKVIFRQNSTPVPIDVLWYDTTDGTLKYYESNTYTWRPVKRRQLSGSLTPNAPTAAELNSVIGQTASQAGIGFKVTVRNINDSTLYLIESDGKDWYYKKLSKIGLVTDYDGNEYHTIKVGNLEWMVENLKTTHYADGESIPNIVDATTWQNDTTGAYCWYNNDIANKDVYGALYNWYAVNNAHGLAPTGWRIPTKSDYETLVESLGGDMIAGGKLKEKGLEHWNSPNLGATDEIGFTARPGGSRSTNFLDIQNHAYFWSTTEYDTSYAYSISLYYNIVVALIWYWPKYFGFSIRCVRDV